MSSLPTSLTGKVAVVTGSSRGIGAAIALRLGEEGATVVVNCKSFPVLSVHPLMRCRFIDVNSSTAAEKIVSAIKAQGKGPSAF
ncbi:hypothetical protein VKT23_017419 [Stygiomarasmius scandens]|uniref:Uncharacterized protein n=1 Tax=Marasmiellus scandens TaxID=2682957 RepID=A0ABR1IUG9_9AGAR